MENVNKRNYDGMVDYVNRLFDVYSKLQVLRLDLSYKKSCASGLEIKDAKKDLQHFLSNRRTKPSLFKHCVGHVWKLETTPVKGPHFHCALLYDGSQVIKDAHLASKIGTYWNEQITDGRGIHFNCNAKKTSYDKCGIGMISHTDEEMRNNLITEVLPYLAKTTQGIDSPQSGNERCFGKGIIRKKKSKAGRPRT